MRQAEDRALGQLLQVAPFRGVQHVVVIVIKYFQRLLPIDLMLIGARVLAAITAIELQLISNRCQSIQRLACGSRHIDACGLGEGAQGCIGGSRKIQRLNEVLNAFDGGELAHGLPRALQLVQGQRAQPLACAAAQAAEQAQGDGGLLHRLNIRLGHAKFEVQANGEIATFEVLACDPALVIKQSLPE